MPTSLINFFSKIISYISSKSKLGSGSTWPGHIALKLDSNFIPHVLKKNKNLKIILVAGTNGKTTTSKLIRHILEKNNIRVFQNSSGANLLNGLASTLIQYSNLVGKLDFDAAIFEVDENTLQKALEECNPTAVVLLNLFRDQLDRYGEVNTIADKWNHTLQEYPSSKVRSSRAARTVSIIANGDDPMLSFITKDATNAHYFGIDKKYMKKKELSHDVDFVYCPLCEERKLKFELVSYSHMGLFRCPNCGFENFPQVKRYKDLDINLMGTYNLYNVNAAALTCQTVFDISEEKIKDSLKDFKAAFGRQEVIEYKGRKIIVLLSKNPAGFNQSLDVVNNHISQLHPDPAFAGEGSRDSSLPLADQNDRNERSRQSSNNKLPNVLLVLNDRIPDGRDVSWIWDVDFEDLKAEKIFISGDRAYDMTLRILYSQNQSQNSSLKTQIHNSKLQTHKTSICENLNEAIEKAVEKTKPGETLFILPTYSAMLEVRQILKGRKIL